MIYMIYMIYMVSIRTSDLFRRLVYLITQNFKIP